MLTDYEQIQQVLARYSRGIDRRDRDILTSVYWEDAVDRHGAFDGPAKEAIEFFLGVLPQFHATSHFLGQSIVDIKGQRATSEIYFYAAHLLLDAPNVPEWLSGRYVDQLEKRGNEWRILDRQVIYDWWSDTPWLMKQFSGSSFVRGYPSDRDASYNILS